MPWNVILPTVISGSFGLATALVIWRVNRKSREATVIGTQAEAIERYWKRIEDLEDEIREIKEESQAKIERLTQENQRMAAQIGRMQMQLDEYRRES